MLITLPFNGTVAAGGELTLVSNHLRIPYMVRSLHVSFALGTDRTVQIRFFRSPDDSTPGSGHPSGTELLLQYSRTPYLVGDDERKSFPHEFAVRESGSWLKVHAKNNDTFSHTVDCQIVIDLDPPEFE